MNDYPRIADHGLIGDLQTTALVSTDGTIDWFCSPRFDSPSIFASLLDRAKEGISVRIRMTTRLSRSSSISPTRPFSSPGSSRRTEWAK